MYKPKWRVYTLYAIRPYIRAHHNTQTAHAYSDGNHLFPRGQERTPKHSEVWYKFLSSITTTLSRLHALVERCQYMLQHIKIRKNVSLF